MGAAASCTLGASEALVHSSGPSLTKPKRFKKNKQASLTLQGSVETDEDIFDVLNVGLDETEYDVEGLREMSKKNDTKLWKRIHQQLELLGREEIVEDYLYKLHKELQLFTKTLKLLGKMLQIDMDNIGNTMSFLNNALKIILNCEHVTLFIMNHSTNTLRTHGSANVSIKVEVGKGIAGTVAETGETLNIEDAYKHPLFNPKFDIETGFKTNTILCVPMNDEDGNRMAVLEGVNCCDGVFNDMHVVNLELIGAHLCNVIKKCQLVEAKKKHEMGTKALFKLFKVLYTDLPVDDLLRKCIDTAKGLVSSERATLFVYDDRKDVLWARSGHGLNDRDERSIILNAAEGVAGKCLNEDVVVNLSCHEKRTSVSWSDKFDKKFGFKTRNIMAVPIKDSKDKKIGVLQVINKEVSSFDFLTDSRFSAFDEKVLKDFSGELGRAIGGRILEAAFQQRINEDQGEDTGIKSQLMEYTKSGSAKKKRLSRKSTYHKTAKNEDENSGEISFSKAQVDIWHFDCSQMSKAELNSFVKALFFHLELQTMFNIDLQKLSAFLQKVGETYEDVPYHNYNHAVSVLHGVYAFLTLGKLTERLEDIEVLAMFVGALCHDIGHDGFTNGFHILTMSDLAATYNDLHVQENLHASLCNKIFNQEETRFVTLTPEDSKRLRKLMIQLIISTDMAEHMSITTTFKQKELDLDVQEDRMQIMKSVLHAVDVSTPAKPNDQSVVQAQKLAAEFKRQVDKEISLGLEPLPFMNPKDVSTGAQLEINFIDYVVQPLWESMVGLFPMSKVFLDNLEANREYYQNLLIEEYRQGRI